MLVVSPTHGLLMLSPDGTFSYKHDGSETVTDVFAYVASDGIHESEVISVTITVQPVNDAPLAMTDTISVTQGGTATSLVSGENSVLTNDVDVDSPTLSAVLVQEPAFGTITLNDDGTFAYSHAGGSSQTDTFRYKATDGEAESAPIDVLIQIDTPVGNEEPTSSGDVFIYIPFTN